MADENPDAKQGSDSQATAEPAAEQVDERTQLAQLERRLSTRTYAGGAALVLALAAAIVAIVLAVDARENSASEGQVDRLQEQLAAVAEQAGASEEAQEGVETLGGRLDTVEDELDGLSGADKEVGKRLDVIEDDIEDLRQQISDLETDTSGGGSDGPPEAD